MTNIIRTTAVELAAIPAIAYKQKLASGGAGIKIQRLDTEAMAMFTIDRRSGEALPYGSVDEVLFPDEAVYEAKELTAGLPYTARGKIKITVFAGPKEEEDVTDADTEAVDMVDSPEYLALTGRYAGANGKLNYQLMNKDFIQFASRSTIVGQMVAERASEQEILDYIVAARAAFLCGEKEPLGPAETAALIETLDEIDPRSAFKELRLHLRRVMSKTK